MGEFFDNVTKGIKTKSTKTMVKTMYDEGKNRTFYKYKTKIKSDDLESIHSLDNFSSSSSEVGENSRSLTYIELRRLKKVNDRSTCLVFNHFRELPQVQDIMDLNPDIVGIVQAKFRAPSCFCVFKDKRLRDLAVQSLDGLRFREGYVSVDSHGKMVPVDTCDLDSTRELRTLAVHGIARDVTSTDLRKAFPRAKDVKIAQRGGSAFLTYEDSQACSQAFLGAEDIRVRGYGVQVLFGHVLVRNLRRKLSYGNSGSFKPTFRNNHSFASPSRVATRKESVMRSPLKSLPTAKTPSKFEFRSLQYVLDDSGLKMDELRSDYMRGRSEPGSGPDIRTSWIDRLRANTNMSRSTILDLVDNVWNVIEEDVGRQQQFRMEKYREKEGRRSREESKSKWLERDKTKKARNNSFSPEKKMHRNRCGQEQNIERNWESRCAPDRNMHRSWENDRCKKSRNSTHHKRISSPKQIKLEYDSSSHSPQRVQKSANYDDMKSRENEIIMKLDGIKKEEEGPRKGTLEPTSITSSRRKSSSLSPQRVQKSARRGKEIIKNLDGKSKEDGSPRKRKLEPPSRSSSRSNSRNDGQESQKKENCKADELPKQAKKLKKSRESAIISDSKQSGKNYKTEMMLSKTKMMKKLREKSVDLKSGMKVIDKVLKKYKLVKERGKIKQREKEQNNKEGSQKYKEEYLPLTNHIKTELDHNGFIANASSEVDQIVDCFLLQGLRFKDLEHEYLRHLTKSTHSGKLREKLASLLSGAGFKNSSGIGPNLAAGLTLEYLHSNPTTQTKLVKWRQSSLIMDKKLDQLEQKMETGCKNPPNHWKSIPHKIVEASEGFPRMSLVMAGRLADTSQMDGELSKTKAAAMVEVWTNYGFTYDELADIYATQRERECDANPEDVSLLGMRRLLHSRLRKKVEEGHEMPRKFGFSLLIDLTMFYFEKAT